MERRINVLAVMCLLALTFGCLIAVRTVQRQQSEQRWIDHTHKVRQMVHDIQYAVTAAESVRRAYLLTSDEKYADGVRTMEEAYHTGIDALRMFISDNKRQRERIDVLATLIERRFDLVKQSVALHRRDPRYSRQQNDLTVQGFALSESIRKQVTTIDEFEYGLLLDRQRRYAATNESAARGVAVLGILGILIASAIFGALRNEVIHRRNAEAITRQQALTLSAILDNMREGVMVYDKKGVITRVNPAASSIIGAPLEGTSPEDRMARGSIRGDDGETPMTADEMPSARALRGETVDHEIVCIKNETHPEGLWLACSATPLRDGGGAQIGATTVFRDITDFMNQQEEIHRLNVRLQGSIKHLESSNKELEAFSYTVSHDLRSPLRAIHGFAEALNEDYSDLLDETGLNYLKRISAASQRMSELIDGLLSLTQIANANLVRKEDDLSAFALALAAEFSARTPERKAVFTIEPGMIAFVDPKLIHIVIDNLLENAWKFTANRDQAVIEFGSQSANHGERVYFVRDNGVGFDGSTAGKKLFSMFHRLHTAQDFAGNGIGLATVQRIIHVHGGRIWAESKPDEGATFFFTLGAGAEETSATQVVAA